jgi:hypothetical protein
MSAFRIADWSLRICWSRQTIQLGHADTQNIDFECFYFPLPWQRSVCCQAFANMCCIHVLDPGAGPRGCASQNFWYDNWRSCSAVITEPDPAPSPDMLTDVTKYTGQLILTGSFKRRTQIFELTTKSFIFCELGREPEVSNQEVEAASRASIGFGGMCWNLVHGRRVRK